jgi:predicted pyridoxine 5'-phosphate oxidase superfamily flavin-nucleotide-binding protein
MAKFFEQIEPPLREFIERQRIFFTASATANSRINLSPKGSDCLRVLDDSTVAYLDQTGSGNETAAHTRADGRLTIMFCAFEGPPMILRLYGRGRSAPRGCDEYSRLLADAFAGDEPPGARQIVVLDVESVQTSCGYSVPLYEFKDDRQTLKNWASRQGEEGLRTYWRQKNTVSIDGLPTGMNESLAAD